MTPYLLVFLLIFTSGTLSLSCDITEYPTECIDDVEEEFECWALVGIQYNETCTELGYQMGSCCYGGELFHELIF